MTNNVLSLDPMFSPLHRRIANLVRARNKFALLSNIGLGYYLPGFKRYYIHRLVLAMDDAGASLNSSDILALEFLYKSYVQKVLGRELNEEETLYFKKYYTSLEIFIEANKIELVIVHNDMRWQHAIAIEVCKKLGVVCLTTEQGVLRPYTTIIDSQGVLRNSSLRESFEDYYNKKVTYCGLRTKMIASDVTDSHNSFITKSHFGMFLLLKMISDYCGFSARYQHNRYSILTYLNRYFYHFQHGSLGNKATRSLDFLIDKKVIFFPMQLWNDSQILVNSSYSSMSCVLELIESSVEALGGEDVVLVVKSHPNDLLNYNFSQTTLVINDVSASELVSVADVVVLVNSSVAYEVLQTRVPLISLGDAVFNMNGLCTHSDSSALVDLIREMLNEPEKYVDTALRNSFIDYIKNIYSVHGAGYCYFDDELMRVLQINKVV